MRRFTAVLGTVSMVLFAVAAHAAQQTGEVTSVDPAGRQIQIELEDGEEMTFEIAPEVRVKQSDGETVNLQQLRPGSRVTLDVRDTGGVREVQSIQILSSQQAQQRQGDANTGDRAMDSERVEGEVVSTSQNQVVIRTDDGQRMTYQVGSGATVRVDGRSVQVSELRQGQRVAVSTRQEGSQRVATEIEVRDDFDRQQQTAQQQRDRMDREQRMQQERDREQRFAGNLPSTASPLPMIGLMGAAALALAGGLRGLRRR